MPTYRITCVCLGNICRSPMAEAVLRRHVQHAGLAGQVEVDSAGTAGYHVGDDADRRALATLLGAGYDLAHRARKFDADWFDQSHLILAMDQSNYADLLDLAREVGADTGHVRLLRSFDPTADPGAEVPDPYYGGADGFREVLAMIERAGAGVVDHVRSHLAATAG